MASLFVLGADTALLAAAAPELAKAAIVPNFPAEGERQGRRRPQSAGFEPLASLNARSRAHPFMLAIAKSGYKRL